MDVVPILPPSVGEATMILQLFRVAVPSDPSLLPRINASLVASSKLEEEIMHYFPKGIKYPVNQDARGNGFTYSRFVFQFRNL